MTEPKITYTVERSARRTVGIYVERDGSVLVRAPQLVSDERIAAAVTSKSRWVYRTQARWAQLNPRAAKKEFVSGETVYFLGKPHRLEFRDETSKLTDLEGDVFVIRSSARSRTEDMLRGYYRAEGLKRLPQIVQEHAVTMGLVPASVRVLEIGFRWASCSAKGTLNFHWKAMAVPIDVLHYLVVHELAHLVHRDHSKRFWKLVETEIPGWRSRANWLTQHGAQMAL